MEEQKEFEAIIIGGSYAGLSAAMALGRSLRKVLIIDSGKPCNRQTPNSHNFLTRDGETPTNLNTIAKSQVLDYPTIEFLNGVAIGAFRTENGFSVKVENGTTFRCKKIIITSGVKDIFPTIKGFTDCWGISVLHCPYCHGYEVKGKKTGIIANGEMGFEFSKLISNWTKDLTLFTNGPVNLDEKSIEKLALKNINIVDKEIAEIIHSEGYVTHIKFKNESIQQLEAIYAKVTFEQNTKIIADLNIELNEQGYITVDNFKETTQTGVFAAGDCTTMMRAVSESVYAGSMAGIFANKQLIGEAF